jgi:uncharacterized membrane protein (UPF0182 family)
MIVAAILLIIFFASAAGYVQKGLWMQQLHYAGIFWGLLAIRWTMFCAAFLIAFLYLSINLRGAARHGAFLQGWFTGRTRSRR